jgi:hypothetical protein
MEINFSEINEFSFGYIVNVEKSAKEFAIKWKLINYDLIKCGTHMTFQKFNNINVGTKHFRCPNYKCRHFTSLLKNTMFFKSNLEWKLIFQIIFMWCQNRKVTECTKSLNISEHTATKWYSFCRNVCSIIMSNLNNKIGGKNSIVEIDETHLWTRKYHRVKIIQKKI